MAWVSLAQILRVDAFAKFHRTGVPVGSEAGVTLTGFHMNAYEKGRLAASADVDKVEVRRDRSQFAMTGVHNGRFFPTDGDPVQFEMQNATYFYFLGRMTAENGAHVVGKDMDLLSDKFMYEEQSKSLLVRGAVRGKLYDGLVTASDVLLRSDSKALDASDVLWKGNVEAMAQEDQRKQWTFGSKGNHLSISPDGKVQTWTPGRATDGEVIVVADKVVYTKDTDVLVATGNVKYWGVDANVLCDEATVYHKVRRAVMTGVVRMLLKSDDNKKVEEAEIPSVERVTPESIKTNPQGANKEQIDLLRNSDNLRKYPIKVVADQVEYWYKKGERHAVITGNPFARQDFTEGWRLGWAFEALYDGETEKLTLKSKPGELTVQIALSIGDYYKALDMTLSTKDGDKSMDGHDVQGVAFLEDNEVPTRTGGGTSTGGSTGGGTTGGKTGGGTGGS